MIARRHNFAVDKTLDIGITNPGAAGISITIENGGNLGGGTLTVQGKPAEDTGTFETLNDNTALALGDQKAIYCGGNMQIRLEISGSTTPDVDVIVTELGGA